MNASLFALSDLIYRGAIVKVASLQLVCRLVIEIKSRAIFLLRRTQVLTFGVTLVRESCNSSNFLPKTEAFCLANGRLFRDRSKPVCIGAVVCSAIVFQKRIA